MSEIVNGNQLTKPPGIFKRVFSAIWLFILTVTGVKQRQQQKEQNILLARLELAIQQIFIPESTKMRTAIAKTGEFIGQGLQRLYGKAYFPIMINKTGLIVNLAIQRDMKVEAEYKPDGNFLMFLLSADKKLFDSARLDLEKFNPKHPAKPVWDLGRVMLGQRKEGFTTHIGGWVGVHILKLSNVKDALVHADLFECCVQGFLDAAKPFYIQEKDLKDFDLLKGPVEWTEEEKVQRAKEAEEVQEIPDEKEKNEPELKFVDTSKKIELDKDEHGESGAKPEQKAEQTEKAE